MISPEARAALERLRTIAAMVDHDGADVAREAVKLVEMLLLDRYADETVIDETWLRSAGFLPDGEDTGEFARKIWSAGETEDYGTDPAMHIVWSTIDDSCWLEAYDRDGNSLAVIELDGIKTRGQLRRLTDALGIELKEEPKP